MDVAFVSGDVLESCCVTNGLIKGKENRTEEEGPEYLEEDLEVVERAISGIRPVACCRRFSGCIPLT